LFTAQSSGDNLNSTSSLTWDALQQMGIPVSYRAFAARWDQEDQLPPEQQVLHKMVDKFDGTGLTLKTTEEEPEVGTDSGQSEVEKMAKRATKLGK
jgi:hypothetical protein